MLLSLVVLFKRVTRLNDIVTNFLLNTASMKFLHIVSTYYYPEYTRVSHSIQSFLCTEAFAEFQNK